MSDWVTVSLQARLLTRVIGQPPCGNRRHVGLLAAPKSIEDRQVPDTLPPSQRRSRWQAPVLPPTPSATAEIGSAQLQVIWNDPEQRCARITVEQHQLGIDAERHHDLIPRSFACNCGDQDNLRAKWCRASPRAARCAPPPTSCIGDPGHVHHVPVRPYKA